jgi:hypothetical protein
MADELKTFHIGDILSGTRYGFWHELIPLSHPVYIDPITELSDKIGADKVIVVEA